MHVLIFNIVLLLMIVAVYSYNELTTVCAPAFLPRDLRSGRSMNDSACLCCWVIIGSVNIVQLFRRPEDVFSCDFMCVLD